MKGSLRIHYYMTFLVLSTLIIIKQKLCDTFFLNMKIEGCPLIRNTTCFLVCSDVISKKSLEYTKKHPILGEPT